jgi:signal transduction histidine kinase
MMDGLQLVTDLEHQPFADGADQDLALEVQRVRALYRLSQMVTASLDLDTTLDAIAGAAHQLTASTQTAILLLDPEDNSLSIRLARGAISAAVGERISAGEGIVGRALRERRAVLVPDMLGEPTRARPDLDERFNVRAYVAAPLIWDGKALGVITLGSTQPNGLTEADVELVSSVAEQAAAAVAHARAFGEEQHRRTQSEALARQLAEQAEQLAVMQQQLVQAEKMTAIGQLVDGIAHEMNTPLGVLISNLSVLDEYASGLIDLARAARSTLNLLASGASVEDARRALEPALKGDELDYVLSDLPELIAESTGAAGKVADIVRSMAVFARGDAQRVVSVSVEEAVESALTLAWNTLKHRAEVVREVEAVPPIMGHSSELTQVFLHLLLNAAQALEKGPGVVSVRIAHTGDAVTVSIADTGPGIPLEQLARVFDPFFSTRPPGQGTGMGLTVCHGIVTRHRGTIELQNAPEGGAVAIVRLPVATEAAKEAA